MGILIKGMTMPKSCDNCPCYYETEGAWRNECQVLREECAISEGRPSWCPLIEVPPHGRLIDANVLMENEENISFKDEWHMTVTEAFVSVKNIAHAPTIIEAEEGE